MVKLEQKTFPDSTVMKSINHRSRSSSVSSNGSINNNNNYGYSSSDSFLSLIESPVSSSSKNQSNQQQNQTYFRNRKRTHDRVNIVANGTIIKDSNNNNWMVQNCIKARHERYLYTVTPVKHQSAQQQQQQHNIVKTKISPLMFLTEKLKESREDILNKAKAQNEELDYVFYGAVMTTSDDNNNNNTNEHSVTNSTTANQLTWSSSCTLSLSSADSVEKKNKQLFSKFNGSEITPQHQKPKQVYEHNHHHQCEKVTKVIHGIVEFLKNDETYDSNKVNKYSVEMVFTQDKSQQNDNPSDLLQQVLKKEIFKLKEIRRKNTSNSNGDGFYKFIVKKDRLNDRNTYELHEQDEEQQTETNSKVIPTPIQPPIKYLLKLELSSANKTSTSSLYTIDNEINFYSKFATQDKLKSFIKKHQLMYLAIPEYVASGLYKHTNGSIYKFLIMEQYRDNLKSLINSYDSSLPEHNALNLFLQVLYVLQYIHEKNYVHKIIKPKYLTFASKQPYFIYLTQFRTVKYINDDTINDDRQQQNRPVSERKQHQKKKAKRSHIQNNKIVSMNTDLTLNDIVSSSNIDISMDDDDLYQYKHVYNVFISLDMHLYNKQTYRGDLEMLGYNLIVWIGGCLPWNKKLKSKLTQSTITNEKQLAKSNVNEFVKKCFYMKLVNPVVLRAICDYMTMIYQLNIDDLPNYDQLRAPIREIIKALGFKANACLRLSNSKTKSNSNDNATTGQQGNSNVKNAQEFSRPSHSIEEEQEDGDDETSEDGEDDVENGDDNDENSCDENEKEQQQKDEQQQQHSDNIQLSTKCKRCGVDHSTPSDQQSSSSGDKQGSLLTYQQKRQRSIAKRLQLRRKKKN